MGLFTLPILGAIGGLAGNLLNSRSAAKQQSVAGAQSYEQFKRELAAFKENRNSERNYAARLTKDDRSYSELMRDNERAYAEAVLLDQRAYGEKSLASDRAYLDQKRNEDVAQYSKDRNFMQNRSNQLAEKSAASRGIDFQRLRDDAVAAGYNPMTALSMAHAYSTNVDYQVQGGVYSPGANYTAVGGGSGAGGGGAAPGAVMGSHMPAAGSFSSPGGGYQRQFEPALSAGTFVKEAMDRAVDTWSNQPVQSDPLADALRRAFDQDQMADQVRDSQIPQGFGYDLTKQKQFQPEATVGVPSFASNNSPRMPTGEFEEGGIKKIPVRGPDNQQFTLDKTIADRLDIKPFDKVMAEDYEAIFGDMPGGAASIYDSPIPHMGNSSLKYVRPSARQKDYVKSGVTGSRQFPKGQHYNPWNQ